MQRSRILVMGASGSGTSTLARALADRWSAPHADADDYFWLPTRPPYTRKRPVADRISLMEAMFMPREAWVLSGSLLDWGESVVMQCEAIVFLTLHPEERLRRLEAREAIRREGQDVDLAAWERFRDWARGYDDPDFAGRSRASHEAWLETRRMPVLRLDSALPSAQLVEAVLAWEPR